MQTGCNVIRWGLYGIFLVSAGAGCASDTRVVNPLPSPYHLDYREPTRTVPQTLSPSETAPAAETPKSQPTHQAVKPKWAPEHPLSNCWQYIIIHHSKSEGGSLRDIDQWHFQQGWEYGCGYHFVIGNGTGSRDGQIEVSRRWRLQIHGAHTRLSASFANSRGVHFQHYNDHGIGVVLVGDFDAERPTPRQMEELVELVADLMDLCDIPPERVYSHGEVDQTRCPGRYFNIQALRSRLARSSGRPTGAVGFRAGGPKTGPKPGQSRF